MRSTFILDEKTEPVETEMKSDGSVASLLKPLYTKLFPGMTLFTRPSVLPEEEKTDLDTVCEFDDGDCEKIEMSDIRFRDLPYSRNQIDLLLGKMLEKNGYNFTRSFNTIFTNSYSVYTHNKTLETVALFPVVKDREDTVFLKDTFILSLESVMSAHSFYREKNNKIIIPLVESILPHYRLITLDLDCRSGLYHDSKSPLASSASELGRAVISSAMATAKALVDQVAPHPVELPGFVETWYYVENLCAKYFYNLQIIRNCMNHQEFYNEADTGAYVVTYADLFLQGADLQTPFVLKIDDKKEEYHRLLYSITPEARSGSPSARRWC
jgi:hypothetical protein